MDTQRFLQTPFWAEFKASHGWNALYFWLGRGDDGTLNLTPATTKPQGMATGQRQQLLCVLVRRFSALGMKRSLAYVPMGPEGLETFLACAQKYTSDDGRVLETPLGCAQNYTSVSTTVAPQAEPCAQKCTGDGGMDGMTGDTTERSVVLAGGANDRSLGAGVDTTDRLVGFAHDVARATEQSVVFADGETSATERLVGGAWAELLSQVGGLLVPYLPKDTMFVRFDPPVDCATVQERDAFIQGAKAAGGVKKSPVDIQPPDTSLLDLTQTEEQILARMKSKWRYNIRLAAKKGVVVTRHTAGQPGFDAAFEQFYALFMQTSERDGVSFHAKDYYRDLLERGTPLGGGSPMDERPLVTLYLATHQGEPLAGIITLFCPREAVYLYGASGNAKRNLMPAYLLQWTAIQDAKEYGAPVYDFYGMPPDDNEAHPMHGLYLFKTGFGGTTVHRPGSFDVPLRPLGYWLYERAEHLRAIWHKKVLKRLKGR